MNYTVGRCGPGSSVGIATELRAGRSGDRIPVGGARFSTPVQTGPGAHPASCTMGTGSFPGVKYGQGVLLTTHPLLVPWSWKSRAIPLPTLCNRVTLILLSIFILQITVTQLSTAEWGPIVPHSAIFDVIHTVVHSPALIWDCVVHKSSIISHCAALQLRVDFVDCVSRFHIPLDKRMRFQWSALCLWLHETALGS
jgi:hypothetical protein